MMVILNIIGINKKMSRYDGDDDGDENAVALFIYSFYYFMVWIMGKW